MPYSQVEKKRVITRLRRIRGQADALERAVEAGTDCGALLQQLAALRGATTGLMAELFESHLRETFGSVDRPERSAQAPEGDVDALMRIVRSYLK